MELKHLILIFCFSISALVNVQAQWKENLEYGIGYFGNTIMNPGVELTAAKPLLSTVGKSEKYSALGDSEINFQVGLAGYWDPFSHHGIVNSYDILVRQYFGKRIGFQMGFGLILQSNITSENYIINEDFEPRKQRLKFNNYNGVRLVAGSFIDGKKNKRAIYSGFSMAFIGPYNSSVLPVFSYHLTYLIK